MIKLVVTDLDGTLLKDNHEVPERFWDIADRLFRKGVKLGIASGRPHYSITENFRSIMEHLYAISDNGSMIIHNKTELFSKPLPQHEIEALVMAARSAPHGWPILCGKDTWYVENSDSRLLEKISNYIRNFKVVDDLTKVDDAVLKITVLDLMGAEQYSYPYFKQFEDRLKIAVGGAVWLDITRTDANKGEAVQALQQLNGITPDETLVFGDFMNDYEMMKAATYSYAMKNSYSKILEVANFVTEKDNNEEGILDVIEALCFGS